MQLKKYFNNKTVLASLLAAGSNGALASLFSQWIGWNSWSLLGFWLILTPLVLMYIPALLVQSYYRLLAALLACLVFYLGVFIIIFLDYNSQFNNIMLFGMLTTLISLLFLYWRMNRLKRKYPK